MVGERIETPRELRDEIARVVALQMVWGDPVENRPEFGSWKPPQVREFTLAVADSLLGVFDVRPRTAGDSQPATPRGVTAEKLREVSWVLNGHVGLMGITEASELLDAWADELDTR